LLRRQKLVSDARRNVRLYSTIKDRKSQLKGSRPSVSHRTNFLLFVNSLYISSWLKIKKRPTTIKMVASQHPLSFVFSA